LALVASPDMGKLYSDFVTGDKKLPVSFIINETNCIFRQIFEDYLKEKSLILDHTIELWSIPTIKNLVKSDVGISFLPRFAVARELAAGELVELPTAVSHPYIRAVCAHHKNKWISPLVQLFIDLCKGIE
jgi:DNA-binding transcriptional LysR family regulator